jgi:uncharacterized protein (TIGR02246 family)
MTTLSGTDLDAIHQLVAEASDSQFDADALSSLHSEGAIVVNVAGRRILGRDEFTKAARAALGGSLASVRTSVEVIDIRAVTAESAIVSMVKRIHDGRTDGDGDLPTETVMSYVVVRGSAGWRIALAQTTPLA